MKKNVTIIIMAFLCLGLLFSIYGCSMRPKLKAGVVNRQKILANWSKYRDLMGEYQIERDLLLSKLPKNSRDLTAQQKEEVNKLNQKWARVGKDLEAEFIVFVEKTAKKKKVDIVVSKDSVEYGGIDITDEIKLK